MANLKSGDKATWTYRGRGEPVEIVASYPDGYGVWRLDGYSGVSFARADELKPLAELPKEKAVDRFRAGDVARDAAGRFWVCDESMGVTGTPFEGSLCKLEYRASPESLAALPKANTPWIEQQESSGCFIYWLGEHNGAQSVCSWDGIISSDGMGHRGWVEALANGAASPSSVKRWLERQEAERAAEEAGDGMTDRRCETCRHWGRNAPTRAVERHEVDCKTKLPEHQFCDAPMAVGRPEPMGPRGRRNAQPTPPLAIVANYYDEEGGMLLTAPSFFCAMWEVKR